MIDEYIDTNWAALQGNTSEVNSSTAMRVAHEAVNIVAGFDSVAASAKAHFYASGVFGQLAQGGVSGTFESIEVNCPTAGAGLVSGNITVAGTFSQGDFVSAEFTNCVDQFDAVLNGPLDFTVSSYELLDPEVGLYRLDGDASMPCLERAAEGRTYVGCGDVETSYDGAAWPPGGIVTASSADFTVAFDDMDRYVSNATVRTATIIGPPWIMVDRSSSGSFGAPGLGGRYSYENTVPDTYMVDDDPATGPSGGVLKVTADDGSAVYIIAVDELNVRLEVDDDGDMLTDWSVWTTWAELY